MNIDHYIKKAEEVSKRYTANGMAGIEEKWIADWYIATPLSISLIKNGPQYRNTIEILANLMLIRETPLMRELNEEV